MQDHFLLRIMNLEQTLKSEIDSSFWIWGLLIFLCLMGQVLCVFMLAKSDPPMNSDLLIPEETPINEQTKNEQDVQCDAADDGI